MRFVIKMGPLYRTRNSEQLWTRDPENKEIMKTSLKAAELVRESTEKIHLDFSEKPIFRVVDTGSDLFYFSLQQQDAVDKAYIWAAEGKVVHIELVNAILSENVQVHGYYNPDKQYSSTPEPWPVEEKAPVDTPVRGRPRKDRDYLL